jgi:preprotein translocase subunit SecD
MKSALQNLAIATFAASLFCGPAAAKTTLEFRLVVECMPGDRPLTLKPAGETLCVTKSNIADLSNVTSAALGYVSGNEAIRVVLNSAGAARMKAATTTHPNGRMAIFYNGVLVSAPAYYGVISDFVEVDFGEHGSKLKEIAAALKSAIGRK